VGGRGRTHVNAYAEENIVAFCDVDYENAAESFEKHPKVPRVKDFRKLFDRYGDKLDAVSIATPDHMHYPIALWALQQGLHVLCEKPLVRRVWEARRLKDAARKAGVVTQMGNQGHANEGLRLIKEWTRAGVIGDIVEVLHWSNRPIWPQGDLTRQNEPVPTGLDYPLWLGVAPDKPYDANIVPFNWRGWKDYGCGAVGDMACHIMDSSFSGLDLGIPTAVDSEASSIWPETYPTASTIQFTLPRRDGGGSVKATWFDGGRLPDLERVPGVPGDFFDEKLDEEGNRERQNPNGSFIVGTRGTLYTNSYNSTVKIFPEDYFMDLRRNQALPPKTLERVKGGHFREFTDAIRNGTSAGANFDYAADFTETALLGLVSMEAGGRIEYDAKNMRVTNNEEANRYLYSEYEYNRSFLPS